jgi:hypothetical protein
MRKTVIAFPLDRQAKSPARPDAVRTSRPLIGRWSVNAYTGRLEQHWTADEPTVEAVATGTDGLGFPH